MMLCQCAMEACCAMSDPLGLTTNVLGAYRRFRFHLQVFDLPLNVCENYEMRNAYLNTQAKQRGQFFLKILTDHSIDLLQQCRELLLESKSWVLGFNLGNIS